MLFLKTERRRNYAKTQDGVQSAGNGAEGNNFNCAMLKTVPSRLDVPNVIPIGI